MRRILPSIIATLISALIIFFGYKTQSNTDNTVVYLLACVSLLFIFNILFLSLLKRAKGMNSISFTLGISGLSMFLFIGMILASPTFTGLDLNLKTTLFLFLGYVLMKIGLLYPVIQQKD